MSCPIVHREGLTLLELSAQDWGYPIQVERGGQAFKVFIHLSPYSRAEMDELLSSMAGTTKLESGSFLELDAPGRTAAIPMFDKHFLTMGPVTNNNGHAPTREEMMRFLDKNPMLKIRGIAEGYGGFRVAEQDEEISPSSISLCLDEEIRETIIKLELKLFCAEHDIEETVFSTHVLRPESEEDIARYDRATGKSRLNRKKGSWKRTADHDALNRLYDAMVLRVEGAEVAGQPCEEGSKGRKPYWMDAVPYWHKFLVLSEAFDRMQIKNG